MNVMPNLRPFRDYSEHAVINLFACDTIADKGTLVKPIRSWKDNGAGTGTDSSTAGPLKLSSTSVGGKFRTTLNDFFTLNGLVTPTVNYNDTPKPMGILLKDVREFDENGEPLIFNPRKVEEKDVVIKSIHSAPILTKGLIIVNDIDTTNYGGGGGNPDIGDVAYAGGDGRIATDGLVVVGSFLSPKDENGYCLVNLNIS